MSRSDFVAFDGRAGNLGRAGTFITWPAYRRSWTLEMFFRTQEKRRDRSVDQGARAQRRQQLQAQLQMLDREKAAATAAQPAA
jgi:hypothetical protein